MKSAIMFYAFRYALGRMTYAAQEVAEYIEEHADDLTDSDRLLIIKEARDAIHRDQAGMKMDVDAWMSMVRKLEENNP